MQEETRDFLQRLMDTYESGILITAVKLRTVDAPEQVKDAFHEVVRAREDREKLINQARGYRETSRPKSGDYRRRDQDFSPVLKSATTAYGHLTGRMFGIGQWLRDRQAMRALSRTLAVASLT